MRVHLGFLVVLAACGQRDVPNLSTSPGLVGIVSLPLVDLRADVNRDGIVGDGDEDGEDTWGAQRGAIFLANIDDDLSRCRSDSSMSDVTLAQCNDAADDEVNGADDAADLAPLKIAPWANAPDVVRGVIEVEPAGRVRVFKKFRDGWVAVTGPLAGSELREGVELGLEGLDIVRDADKWDGYVNVSLVLQGAGFDEARDTVRMREAPVLLFHQLLPPVTSYVTRVSFDPSSNDFVGALSGLLQLTPERAPLEQITEQDIWTQDFFETGYMSMPAAGGAQHVIRTAYRSASVWEESDHPLRPAGRVVFTKFRGRDSAGLQAFSLTQNHNSESLNSYGNTETIPPYTLGGVSYPMGRVLRGDIPSFAPDPVLSKVMESQKVQPPVYIDTSWLLVGHVDETISFLKAPNARGWVLLLNDPALARSMLEAQVAAGHGDVQMFIGKSWVDFQTGEMSPATKTISEVLADTDVMMASASATVAIDAQLEIIRAATGLTDAEIIRVPFLHHTTFGASVAYQPGFVNGYAAGLHDFVAPDPFGPLVDGVDIFKADFETKLAAIGYTPRWIDDWNLYHVGAGEVHCGTNAARAIPDAKWWEGGR